MYQVIPTFSQLLEMVSELHVKRLGELRNPGKGFRPGGISVKPAQETWRSLVPRQAGARSRVGDAEIRRRYTEIRVQQLVI